MSIYQQLLIGSDLSCLAKVVGAHWLYVARLRSITAHACSPVGDGCNRPWRSCDHKSCTQTADFEGFDSDYSVLAVDDRPVEWDVAKRKGNVYVQHQGELITNVCVVRETITEVRDGKTAWIYTTISPSSSS
jgi:hypothetical protein